MKVNSEIINIIAAGTVDGNTYYLPPKQLDRKTYEAVNKCLVNLGGKWNRKAKGHVFDYDPAEAIEGLLLTGEIRDMKKEFQFFPTPKPICKKMCDMADLYTARNILEPSCGKGDLADEIWKNNEYLLCVEINKDMGKYLDEKPYTCMLGVDFLTLKPDEVKPFDRIIMNPPFSRQQDVDHILHTYSLLESGGILVSICSPSPFFRSNRKSVEFRDWLESVNAYIEDIPEGAFKVSGTMIRTKIIKIIKS